MLIITVPTSEFFNESTQEFISSSETNLELEHSLVSVSKWEAKFEKPFLGSEPTSEELFWYVKAMTLTTEIPEDLFYRLSEANYMAINDYINAKMTATWFSELPGTGAKTNQIITTELIYFWMIGFNIPFECERWHLNRLFTLIRICNEKQTKTKRMGPQQAAQYQRDLNAKRLKELGTTG